MTQKDTINMLRFELDFILNELETLSKKKAIIEYYLKELENTEIETKQIMVNWYRYLTTHELIDEVQELQDEVKRIKGGCKRKKVPQYKKRQMRKKTNMAHKRT